MDHLQRTTEILGDLIAYPTISADSNFDMIQHMAGLLEDVGARCDVMSSPCGTKANLFATLGPDRNGGVLLSGHSDVVPVTDQAWTRDPFVMDRAGGLLYGRGTCDMKGFIAATLAMAPLFAERVGDRPVHFAFTYDEEVGCLGARHLAETLSERGLTPGVAIIGEPTEMRIIDGHKGCNEYTTRFNGLAGHGSLPDHGVNAVEYAVRYVNHLLGLKEALRARVPDNSPFDPPWTTVNVGALVGGVAHNVIAPSAQVDWEMRPVQQGDAEFVKDSLRRYCEDELLPKMRAVHPGAFITTDTIGEVVGLIPTDENEARKIVSELTGANSCDVVAFGTEAGLFQAMGTDVVVCGPGSIEQAHKADEFIALEQLGQCLGMLERLGHGWVADDCNDIGLTVKDRHAAMHDTLRQRICLLDYPPGTQLSEIALAQEFGISRTPMRRVLARLEEEGLVHSVHGVGTIVTDANITELEQAYRLRVELTALTGRLDPVLPDTVFLDRLQGLIDRAAEMAVSGTPQSFTVLDMEVFEALLELTANEPLRQVLERLYYQTKRLWLVRAIKAELDLQEEYEIFLHELEAIQLAIRSGDLNAVAQIQQAHISMSFNRLLQKKD